MSDANPISDLAILAGLDLLDPQDRAEMDCAAKLHPAASALELVKGRDLAAMVLMARSRPAAPPPGLKDKLLGCIAGLKKTAARDGEHQFIVSAANGGWMPMKIPGAHAKLLSTNQEKGYAVLLGKLDAGARYPGHLHQEQEDVFILEGDLHIGETHLRAGDFHHAAKGSAHDVNWSDGGCVIMMVMSIADLQAQLTAD